MGNSVFPEASTGGLQTRVQKFLSSGTFTVPNGVKSVNVTCVGGGGSGAWNSSGGSGGGVIKRTIDTSALMGTAITVTIGAGGQSGTPGGNSSFGSLLFAGGGSSAVSGWTRDATASGGQIASVPVIVATTPGDNCTKFLSTSTMIAAFPPNFGVTDALYNAGTRIPYYTSTDGGSTWTRRTIVSGGGTTPSGHIQAMFVANNIFISTNMNNQPSESYITYSNDGINWTRWNYTGTNMQTCQDVTYANGTYYFGNTRSSSVDYNMGTATAIGSGSINALNPATNAGEPWWGVVFGAGTYVAYGQSTSSTFAIATSASPTSGFSRVSITAGQAGEWPMHMYHDGTKFVAYTNQNRVYTSTTPASAPWTLARAQTFNSSSGLSSSTTKALNYNGTYFTINSSNGVEYSTNATSWTVVKRPANTTSGGAVVQGTKVLSTDGSNIQTYFDIASPVTGIAYGYTSSSTAGGGAGGPAFITWNGSSQSFVPGPGIDGYGNGGTSTTSAGGFGAGGNNASNGIVIVEYLAA